MSSSPSETIDDSLGHHGVSSVFSRHLRPKSDQNPAQPDLGLCVVFNEMKGGLFTA
ncbi:hypothetical protein F2Q69_00037946 [Brassica cretica]|uniref:Uncharacterized protein n=1 Tax=Brassica cretica TaxID=69181 RepID=A0A8S9SH20_BRACR|nr:hypothetical protein F2Q69_00037946 [Brassica cretica]